MSSKISSPDASTATRVGKFIDVNILLPISETKTINKEIIVHVLKYTRAMKESACTQPLVRSLESVILNIFLKVIHWNPHEQKIQIKKFCAVHHLRSDYSPAWGETDGRSLRSTRRNIKLRPKMNIFVRIFLCEELRTKMRVENIFTA